MRKNLMRNVLGITFVLMTGLALVACDTLGAVKGAAEQTAADVANYVPENNMRRKMMRFEFYNLADDVADQLREEGKPIEAMLFYDCVYPKLLTPEFVNAVANIDLDDNVNSFEFFNILAPECLEQYREGSAE